MHQIHHLHQKKIKKIWGAQPLPRPHPSVGRVYPHAFGARLNINKFWLCHWYTRRSSARHKFAATVLIQWWHRASLQGLIIQFKKERRNDIGAVFQQTSRDGIARTLLAWQQLDNSKAVGFHIMMWTLVQKHCDTIW